MGGGKKPRSSTAKVSAAAAPAISASTTSAGKSSILRSSFAPSHFQLALFASVIQGFDSQQLRIHDTTTGRLRCEHAIGTKATISCLDWGYYGEGYREEHRKDSIKKRKRTEHVNGIVPTDKAQHVVLAFGTSDSEIHLYSPTAGKVVGLLKDLHTQGIRDFRFADAGRQSDGWSIGGNGKLVHWDLRKGRSTRSISLPDPSARTLFPFGSSVLCASHKVFLMDSQLQTPIRSYTASNSVVHSIEASAKRSQESTLPSSFLTAAENDRFINVFNREIGVSIGSLVAESDVMRVVGTCNEDTVFGDDVIPAGAPDLVLAAINRDGVLELFESPFTFGSSSAQKESESLKARMKQRTRRAKALVKVVRPNKPTAVVPLLDAVFQGHELVLVWAEGGVNLHFDKIRWREQDATEVLLEGTHEIVRGTGTAAIGAVTMNGVKDMGQLHVDESQTLVTTGGQAENTQTATEEQPEVIHISSGEEEVDSEDEELPEQASHSSSDDDRPPEPTSQKGSSPRKGIDVTMADVDGTDNVCEGSAEAGADELSFGEMIRAQAPGPVDVQAAFATPNTQALAPSGERPLQLPSGMSLGTVLTQSLRTNDISLLETCLHMRDFPTVRATIERLDSSLASTLIQKLAERFYSRPGRAGSLLIWIQWTIVAHGGYLASQHGAMKTLAALHRVISERARSLPLLLSLKGKLDMLESQMNLRAGMQARSKARIMADDDDEDGVIYVEGQEDDDSGDDLGRSNADDVEMGPSESESGEDAASDPDARAEKDGAMPTTIANGALTESDDESQSSGEELFDEEAESTDRGSGDGASMGEVDHGDVDPLESDASSETEEAPPSKRPAIARLSSGVQ
ncbi:MAG: hypothetical protein Q9196_003474 [Gyalolechia fulgens]